MIISNLMIGRKEKKCVPVYSELSLKQGFNSYFCLDNQVETVNEG